MADRITNKKMEARLRRLRQRAAWFEAQRAGGYSCAVLDIKTGKVIHSGRSAKPDETAAQG